ncbi:MAG TPA: hypothetical protein VGG28_25765 [Kofleriaceae bacterium]|jgi:hypothetical protein
MNRLVLLSLLLPACLINTPSGDDSGDDDGNTQTQMDVDQWNQLVTQDDMRRTQFLGNSFGALAPVGNQLYYQDETNYSPVLYRYDHASGSTIHYEFSIGGGDDTNMRASSNLVVTADDSDDPVTFYAYDATQANQVADSTQLPAPEGAKYDAYAVDGTTVYFVDQSTEGQTTLLRWIPGSSQAPAAVTTLESDGVDVGEFEDFDVSGDTMVFVESGRVWTLDLSTQTATPLDNSIQVNGELDFESDGVMFADENNDLQFFAYATKSITDVSAKIDAHMFPLNMTFASASQYDNTDAGFARWNSDVIYVGDQGLFAYDMTADTVTAIVLSPDLADLTIDYVQPVVLDDGTLFVTGLTSNEGDEGADGPVYEIALSSISGT